MQKNDPRQYSGQQAGYPGGANVSVKPPKKKSGLLGRIVRRFFLLLFTVIFMVVGGLTLAMRHIFNGPSEEAKKVLTMTLLEPSATKWIPALFIGQEAVDAIQTAGEGQMTETETDTSQVVINRGGAVASGDSHEWDNYPDGIRLEEYKGKTFNAHIMIVKDPSRVSLGASYEYNGSNATGFSTSNPGIRLNQVMDKYTEIKAVVNAGAFNDDGTANSTVGSIPAGLTISNGKVVSDLLKDMVPE